jgi:hypothetical protein
VAPLRGAIAQARNHQTGEWHFCSLRPMAAATRAAAVRVPAIRNKQFNRPDFVAAHDSAHGLGCVKTQKIEKRRE